jgi:hypothetical protein
VGECTPAGAVWTQLFVAADGRSVDDYTFFDAKCSNWLTATHLAAGSNSCMPFFDAASQSVHFLRTQLTAPLPSGSAPPPFTWPPRDGLEFFRCTDEHCMRQCSSYRADRLGVCEQANAGNAGPASSMKTCTRPTSMSPQFYTELRFDGPGCTNAPLKANLWPADGTWDNRFATCQLYQSQRMYARCPSDLSAAAATPYPLKLEVAQLNYGLSNSCGVQDAVPMTHMSLYANATCAFGQYYAAYADGVVEHDYKFADPIHCTPMPRRPDWTGKVDQCVRNSDGTSQLWTSTLSPYTQPFWCAIGWLQAPECGRQRERHHSANGGHGVREV